MKSSIRERDQYRIPWNFPGWKYFYAKFISQMGNIDFFFFQFLGFANLNIFLGAIKVVATGSCSL